MGIKDSSELPAQVFEGGFRRDVLNEAGIEIKGVSFDYVTFSIQKGVAKKIWTMATNFPNLAGTGGVDVVEIFSGEGSVGLEVVIMTWEVSSGTMLMVLEVVLMWGSRVKVSRMMIKVVVV